MTASRPSTAAEEFRGAGLVRRTEPAGGPARCGGRTGDDHHHVVCRSRGAVADVDCAVGVGPCPTASGGHGFVIDGTGVVFRGLCPGCSTSRRT